MHPLKELQSLGAGDFHIDLSVQIVWAEHLDEHATLRISHEALNAAQDPAALWSRSAMEVLAHATANAVAVRTLDSTSRVRRLKVGKTFSGDMLVVQVLDREWKTVFQAHEDRNYAHSDSVKVYNRCVREYP